MHDAYEYKFDRYGLTCHGQAVCVEDYCISLSNQKSTHVFLFQDIMNKNPEDGVEAVQQDPYKHVDWTKEFNELRQTDRSGLARFCAQYYMDAKGLAKQVEILDLKKKTRSHKIIFLPDNLGN